MYEGAVGSIRTPSLARQKLVLWLAFGIILIVSLLAFISIERLIAANGKVQERLTLIVEVNRYLSDLKDVETGGRGYALSSGDAPPSAKAERGHRRRPGDRAPAAQDWRTIPELQRQLGRLVPLTAERIAASASSSPSGRIWARRAATCCPACS